MLEPRHCNRKGEEEQVQQAAHPHVQGGAQSWVRLTVAGLPDSPPTYHKMGDPRKVLQTASKNSKVLWGSLPDTCRYHTVLNKGPLCPFLYSKYTQTFQKKTHTWNRNSSLDSAFRFECSYLKREAYCLMNLNCSQNISTQENFENKVPASLKPPSQVDPKQTLRTLPLLRCRNKRKRFISIKPT